MRWRCCIEPKDEMYLFRMTIGSLYTATWRYDVRKKLLGVAVRVDRVKS